METDDIIAHVERKASEQAMEIPFEQESESRIFSYEGIFKHGESLGSMASLSFFVAAGLAIPLVNIICFATYFYFAGIAAWQVYACVIMIMNLFNLSEKLNNDTFFKIALLRIASSACGLIAALIIMPYVYVMTPAWYLLLNYAFLPLLSPSIIQLGILFGIAGTSLELASKFFERVYVKTRENEISTKFANYSFYIDIVVVILSIIILVSALVGDLIGVVSIFAITCIIGIVTSNYMGRAFKVCYYTIMNEQANAIVNRGESILAVKNLKTWFPIRGGFLSKNIGFVKAVDDVTFDIKRGETVALVGESGCGKTTIGRTILGLVKRNSGDIFFNSLKIPLKFPPYLRRRIQFIFQDPDSSLNPRMNILQIISEPLQNLNPEMNKDEIKMRVLQLMDLVSLKYEHLFRFPHEFSGGQKQRIVIARALACNPDFIILDEPTSALDVSVQAQILNLLKELQQKLNLSYLFITHNLSVVHHIANRVAVMYLGKLVELGQVTDIFDNPLHPYTKALLSARSIPDPEKARHRIILKGDVPSPINPPAGCPFNPRCFYEMKSARCKFEPMKMIEVGPDHFIWSSMEDEHACWRYEPTEAIEKPTFDGSSQDEDS